MAITGHFQADFSEFNTAVQQAEVYLESFEAESTKVEASLNRMVDKFSGRKLIQDAALMAEAVERLGGASKLTEKELAQVSAKAAEAGAKMRALGMEVPAGIQNLAAQTQNLGTVTGKTTAVLSGMAGQLSMMFTAGAITAGIISLGRAAFDTADQVDRLAKTLDITTDEAQSLLYIAQQTDTDLGTFSNAIYELQKRLGDRNGGTIGALRALGISVEDFRKLDPYEQFMTAARALAEVEDAGKAASLGNDLFGRSFKDLKPAIEEGADSLRKMAEEAPKLTQEQIDAIKRLDDAWKSLMTNLKVAAGGVIALVSQVNDALETIRGPGPIQNIKDLWSEVAQLVRSGADDIALTIPKIPPAMSSWESSTIGVTHSLEELAAIDKELAAQNAEALTRTKARVAEEEKAQKAYEEQQQALREVNAAGVTWQETLKQVDAELVAHVQQKLEAGVAAEKLAKAYALTDEQIRAITRDLKAQSEEQARANRLLEETEKLHAELAALQIARTGTTTDAQIAEVHRWAAEYKATLADMGGATEENYALIDKIAAEKLTAIMVNWDEVEAASRASLQETADHARATYEFVAQQPQNFSAAAIESFRVAAEAAQQAADDWGSSFEEGADRAIDAAREASVEIQHYAEAVSLSWSQAMEEVQAGRGKMLGVVGGGPGSMTNYGPYGSEAHANAILQASRQGRYFGPVNAHGEPDWGALGMSAPSGAGGSVYGGGVPQPYTGGPVFNNTFNVNGTGADVARVAMDEMQRMMRVGRKWPAV